MQIEIEQKESKLHEPKGKKCPYGSFDYYGEFDCALSAPFNCEECKYGGCGGRKNPEAKKYQ
jgi:hypothetical protein